MLLDCRGAEAVAFAGLDCQINLRGVVGQIDAHFVA